MHAADAIHDDLGMVQQDDVVIIIGKNGESPLKERPKVFPTQSLKEVIVEMTKKKGRRYRGCR